MKVPPGGELTAVNCPTLVGKVADRAHRRVSVSAESGSCHPVTAVHGARRLHSEVSFVRELTMVNRPPPPPSIPQWSGADDCRRRPLLKRSSDTAMCQTPDRCLESRS